MTARMRLALVLAVTAAVRLAPILLADRMVADVLRYQRVAVHVLDVSWNPYEAPRLYPYPPVWIWVEAGSEWLSRHTGASFAVLVKLPVLAADLAIVALLGAWGSRTGRTPRNPPDQWAGRLHALPTGPARGDRWLGPARRSFSTRWSPWSRTAARPRPGWRSSSRRSWRR